MIFLKVGKWMKTILKILKNNSNEVFFDEPITVKMSPHQWPEKIISCHTDSVNVFYKTKDSENKFLAEINLNVINSLRQRLLLLQHDGKIK